MDSWIVLASPRFEQFQYTTFEGSTVKVSLKNWVSVRLGARAAKQDQWQVDNDLVFSGDNLCLLYTSPSPRDS